MKDQEFVLIKKGNTYAKILKSLYESPKKFNNGLTQKEIIAKNKFRQSTEAETLKYLNMTADEALPTIEKPKEDKPKKTNKRVDELLDLAISQKDDQVQGEGGE